MNDRTLISVAMTREAWDEVLMRYSDSVADRCVGSGELETAEQFVLPIKEALGETARTAAQPPLYSPLQIPVYDVAYEIFKQLTAWKEAVVRRMLCYWDPAWGMPVLVHGPSHARVPLYSDMRSLCYQYPTTVSTSVLGLATTEFNDDGIAKNVIKVRASDHIGADNVPMVPEGPFPLPDDTQWEKWGRAADDKAAGAEFCRNWMRRTKDIFDNADVTVGPRVEAPCARAADCRAYVTGLNSGRAYNTCAAIDCPEISRLSVVADCSAGDRCGASHRFVEGKSFLVCEMPDCPTLGKGFEARRRSLRKS